MLCPAATETLPAALLVAVPTPIFTQPLFPCAAAPVETAIVPVVPLCALPEDRVTAPLPDADVPDATTIPPLAPAVVESPD